MEDSGYYPPRARRFRARSSQPVGPARFRLIEWLEQLAGLRIARLAFAALLPGYAFFAHGRRVTGRLVVSAYCVSAVVFIVMLGTTTSSFAFATLNSLHACGLIFLFTRWRMMERLLTRIALSLALIVLTWSLLYSPLLSLINNHLVRPLDNRGRTILSRVGVNPEDLKRGDLVAYGRGFNGNLNLGANPATFGVDVIIGLPGDLVRSTPEGLFANDQLMLSPSPLPAEISVTVPSGHFFIWPASAQLNYNIGQDQAARNLANWSVVPAGNILGKPYRSWFGRTLIEE